MAPTNSSMVPAAASASATSACGTDAFGNVSCSSSAIGSKAGLVGGIIAGVIVLLIAITYLAKKRSRESEPSPAAQIVRGPSRPKLNARHGGEFIPSYQQSRLDPIIQVDCTYPPSYQEDMDNEDEEEYVAPAIDVNRNGALQRVRGHQFVNIEWDNPSPFTQTTFRRPAIQHETLDISPFDQVPVRESTTATLARQTGEEGVYVEVPRQAVLNITVPLPTFQRY